MNSQEKVVALSDFFLRSWRPYVWLALIASLLYLRILTFTEYTHYDDHFLIVESYSHINSFSHLGHAFLEDVSHQAQGGNLYRPLLTISFMLSSHISGMAPFGYHLLDIIFHCISCCLLFFTLVTLGFKKLRSFIGTLIFCVHPALTQAVAWIPGRNDSLLAVFILLCFLSFCKFLSTPSVKWYIAHLLFFVLAMFTKETSIVVPLLALLYFYNEKGTGILSTTTVLFIVGWGIVLFNWHLLRSIAMITPVGDKYQAVQLVLSSLPIALYYLGNIFWPFNLAFAPISTDIHLIPGIISAVLLLVAIILSERRNWKIIFFGATWFVAFLVPTFYYDLTTHMAPKFFEHRVYIPFLGILFILLSLSFTGRGGFIKQIIPSTVFLLIGVLGWFSFTHTIDFKNSMTLCEYDAATSPNDVRRYSDITRMIVPQNLADEIKTIHIRSRLPESTPAAITKEELWNIIDDLRNALQSHPQDPELHHALAVAYFARGLFLSSEENFFAAVQGKPQDATIPYNLGILYYNAHVRKKAKRAWQEALRLNPSMGDAHLTLSFFYYESGQYYSAWLHCQKALQLGIVVPSSLVNEIRRKAS